LSKLLSILSSIAVAATVAACVASRGKAAAPEDPACTIAITAKRFEFEPKEIHLRRGEAVSLAVTSQDVQHGFFSRPLGIDTDLTPGKTEEIRVQPQQEGTYTVICDHYCGSGHGGMRMTVVVE
jgi:cytochrome c oxidase subunit 2